MILIAFSLALQDFSGKQTFPPESDDSPCVKVFGMKRPQAHWQSPAHSRHGQILLFRRQFPGYACYHCLDQGCFRDYGLRKYIFLAVILSNDNSQGLSLSSPTRNSFSVYLLSLFLGFMVTLTIESPDALTRPAGTLSRYGKVV